MRKILLSQIMVIMIALFSINIAFADSIHWQSYSNNVFETAKKSKKLVLLFGKAEWCHWCQLMRSSSYTSSTIIDIVNKYYVPVFVDIDRDSRIADSYGISAVPTTIILNGDRKVIDSTTGYLTTDALARMLRNNAGSS
jgi:uncharacterized protein YyaL (SSP411 family)